MQPFRARLGRECPKQLPREKGESAIAVGLAAVLAARPAPVGLSERVCSLGERFRIPRKETENKRLVRGVEEIKRDGDAECRIASSVTTRRRAIVDSDVHPPCAGSGARGRQSPPPSLSPPECADTAAVQAPKSMKSLLCSRVMFCSADERNDPFRRAEIAPEQSMLISTV